MNHPYFTLLESVKYGLSDIVLLINNGYPFVCASYTER